VWKCHDDADEARRALGAGRHVGQGRKKARVFRGIVGSGARVSWG
jgi:hypothetical protein